MLKVSKESTLIFHRNIRNSCCQWSSPNHPSGLLTGIWCSKDSNSELFRRTLSCSVAFSSSFGFIFFDLWPEPTVAAPQRTSASSWIGIKTRGNPRMSQPHLAIHKPPNFRDDLVVPKPLTGQDGNHQVRIGTTVDSCRRPSKELTGRKP